MASEQEMDLKRLKEELERSRNQLYIFYELTKAMRTTLRLDEIVYIILTGLTAHQGLSFNRAMLFLVDEENKRIRGFMGIGPMDNSEANVVWNHIHIEQKNLYDLIENYNRIKSGEIRPRFMEFIRALSFPVNETAGLIFETLFEKTITHITLDKLSHFANDPLVNALNLNEFLIASVWIKNHPKGIIVVDNNVTHKIINESDIRIFNMFVDQASGAIENSETFEASLTLAHTDILTNLWNHGYFQYKLEEEINYARAHNTPLSLIMIDLDDFKKFNDTYGHIVGDTALKKISDVLKESSRKTDIFCRYGGEEFAVILPQASKEAALLQAERIRKAIESKNISNCCLTASIGLANYPIDCSDKETLISKADQTLYKAKKEGKNRVVME